MHLGHSEMSENEICALVARRGIRVFFIGIGGVSMRSLARLMLSMGAVVCGSDSRYCDLEIPCHVGHKSENIYTFKPELVVYTLAIDENNPEYLTARALGVPLISRAELLGALMRGFEERIGVAGAHGKSTVTAMLASVLLAAGKSPTVLSGAQVGSADAMLIGESGTLLYEACEFSRSFLKTRPTICLITNIELDHVDTYSSIDDIKSAYLEFANLAKIAVLNIDDTRVLQIKDSIISKKVTLSENEGADYRYRAFPSSGGKYTLELYRADNPLLRTELSVIGKYNATNAALCAVCADILSVERDITERALGDFSGIGRRMEKIGKCGECDIYYDYAHHPTEITSALSALRDAGYDKITALFAPHTYSRTKAFFSETAGALSLASRVVVTDIYAARETPIDGVCAEALAAAAGGEYCPIDGVLDKARALSAQSDAVVMLGAGDFGNAKKYFTDNA